LKFGEIAATRRSSIGRRSTAPNPPRSVPHDLIPFIGGRNRVYEVLARKRQPTLKMI
jgi:hypothetical protein